MTMCEEEITQEIRSLVAKLVDRRGGMENIRDGCDRFEAVLEEGSSAQACRQFADAPEAARQLMLDALLGLTLARLMCLGEQPGKPKENGDGDEADDAGDGC